MHPRPRHWEKSLILEWIFIAMWTSQLINRIALIYCFSLPKQCIVIQNDSTFLEATNSGKLFRNELFRRIFWLWLESIGPMPPPAPGVWVSPSEMGQLKSVLSLASAESPHSPCISLLCSQNCWEYCFVLLPAPRRDRRDCICKCSTK